MPTTSKSRSKTTSRSGTKSAGSSKASSKTTTDHDEIREWVEARGGRPARVKRTGKGDDPGLIRIDFPGFSGEGSLEEISWEDFFKAFEDNELAFVYQEKKKSGEPSTFSKLVSREREMAGSSR
jgi:hypothetical protein